MASTAERIAYAPAKFVERLSRADYGMDTEQLIGEVRRREPLYNPLYPGYKDRDMKERLWMEVSEVMQASARECKIRWKTVRDSFQREIKAQYKMKNEGSAYKRKRYAFFEKLMFLMPNLGQQRHEIKSEISNGTVERPDQMNVETISASSSIQEEFSICESNIMLQPRAKGQCIILSPSASNKTQTKSLKNRICKHCKSPIFDERFYKLLEASILLSEEELFVRSLLPSLKRLKDHDQSVIKIRISQMIHEALYGSRK